MQLGEAEELRVLHDDRVHVRDVDAILHDRRGHEHVNLAQCEPHNLGLEIGDSGVGVGDPSLGQCLGEEGHLRFYHLDARHDVEHLAAARKLLTDRILDQPVVALAY